jgi:hypothetical protein
MFADELSKNRAVPIPSEWQARSTWDGERGEVVTGPIKGAQLTDFSEILTKFGYDPDLVEIVGKVNQWRKETPAGDWLTSYFFGVQSKRDHLDLPALYAEVARTKYRPVKPLAGVSTLVVAWADMQLGKVGSRGGTPALLQRMAETRARLDAHIRSRRLARFVFVDVGDAIEGFENVASQRFTNDLSLPQQVDVAAVEMWKTLALLVKYGPVDAVAVPSNHGAWRDGKQSLGRPSDDWGIAIQSRLEHSAELVGLPIVFHRPADWDESVALDVQGVRLGVHHGHQASCDQMPKWWAGQQHGAQPLGDADIFLSGHYHHLRVQPTGRSLRTGKSKWWLQAPTLDNGSDWFRNRSGEDSDPGLLVFEVNDDGFDLSSLTIL